LSDRMALESIGETFAVEKLKARLQEKFPNYNFDVPSEPDTKCKSAHYCKTNTIKYTDTEGNLYCGLRFKLQDDNNPYAWEWATCHALLEKKKVKNNDQELPF